MGDSLKPTVAHLRHGYLQPSETFLYAFLRSTRRYDPIVYTDVAQNLDRFPIDCHYGYEQGEFRQLVDRSDFARNTLLNALDFPNCFEEHIAESKASILHAHFGNAGVAALRLKQRLGIPLVTTFYGIDASAHLRSRRWQEAFSELFRVCDRVVVLGQRMRESLISAGCPEERLVVIHLGVDLEQIPFRERTPPLAGSAVRILFVGRLVPKKGADVLIRAMSTLIDLPLKLRIAGDGPSRFELEQLAAKLGLHDRVEFLGGLEHADVFEEMQSAHLFCLPSRTAPNGDSEGTPTVLMEAQASGLPIVSTHHADIPTVVKDGVTGRLVPEGDVGQLAAAIRHLAEHPELWPQYGREGRRNVTDHFNIATQSAVLESVYDELARP